MNIDIVTENDLKLYEYKYDQYLLEIASDIKKIKAPLNEKTLKRVVEAHKKNMSTIEKYLKKEGIDVDKIKRLGEKAGKIIGQQIADGYKKSTQLNRKPKEVSKQFVEKTTPILKQVAEELTLADKISTAAVLFILILFINSTLMFVSIVLTSLIIPIAGPVVASFIHMIIIACIVAPLTEEYGKKIAVEKNFPWFYTSIFSGLEFLLYLLTWFSAPSTSVLKSLTLLQMVFLRLPAIAMHFFTAFIQKYMKERGEEKSKHIIDQEESSKIGYWLAVACHSAFNLTAVILENLSKL